MSERNRKRDGLQGLLELDRQTIEVGEGYWVSMRATCVPVSKERPHGIQYSLTLHRPGGERIVGYDNAHAPQMRANPSRRSKRPLEYDHVHRGRRMTPYNFKDAGTLLEDFWADVGIVLAKEGVK